MSHRRIVWSLVVAGLTAAVVAVGQTVPGAKADFGPQGGKVDTSKMTPEEQQKFRERIVEQESNNVRTELGASVDEWKSIRPVFDKYNTLFGDLSWADQTKSLPASFTLWGPRAEDTKRPLLEDLKAKTKELKELVEDPKSNEKDIAKKLAEVRAARELMKKDLDKAQSALKKVLTKRQEGLLVMNGKME